MFFLLHLKQSLLRISYQSFVFPIYFLAVVNFLTTLLILRSICIWYPVLQRSIRSLQLTVLCLVFYSHEKYRLIHNPHLTQLDLIPTHIHNGRT